MSEDFDKETTTRKVTSNTPVNGYRVSEELTNTRASDQNSSNAVILGVLLFLAVGAGAVIFYLSSRPAPTPVLVPSPVDTVREKVIERNNTTIKEVTPASPQSTPQVTPRVEINVPAATVMPQPVAPAPTVTVTAQPQPTPVATPKAVTPSATPTPTSGSAN